MKEILYKKHTKSLILVFLMTRLANLNCRAEIPLFIISIHVVSRGDIQQCP